MHATYLLLFISLSVLGQTKPRIQVIPNPKSLEDFDHEFKGCPENSECDQVMGLMLTNWKNLVSKVKDLPDRVKVSQALETFRMKYGIPTEFYTTQKTAIGIKPALYNSACKDHNPKSGEKILKGLSFIKSMTSQTATVWRDQAQIELPLKGNIYPQPVRVYFDSKPVIYQLPINEQPLFIKDHELYILKEEDGFYYTLKISENGDWKIVNLDLSQLSSMEEKRSYLACPADPLRAPAAFGTEFCKSVWDVDAKKTVPVKMYQGCTI